MLPFGYLFRYESANEARACSSERRCHQNCEHEQISIISKPFVHFVIHTTNPLKKFRES